MEDVLALGAGSGAARPPGDDTTDPRAKAAGLGVLGVLLTLAVATHGGASLRHWAATVTGTRATSRSIRLDPASKMPLRPLRVAPISARSGQLAARLARKQLGTPYVWGGTTPNRKLDCSGFVQWAYAQIGIPLPRTTWEQWHTGIQVERAHLRPGDLIFLNDKDHVGMYVGHDHWIEASTSRGQVIIATVPTGGYYGAVRPVAPLNSQRD